MGAFKVTVVKGTLGSGSLCIAQASNKEALCKYASDPDLKDLIDQIEANRLKAAILKLEIDQGRARLSSTFSFMIDFEPRRHGFKTYAAAGLRR